MAIACIVPMLAPTSPAQAQPNGQADAEPAYFDWVEYRGDDAVFMPPLPEGHFRNPVLAGFHADPSVVAANGRFYLVNSTFTYFPGIPVFESTDLVHWTQIGSVIDRPGMLDFDGLGVSRGIFAPTISFHDGAFRVVTTAVDAGGNFISTAADPRGPWSDPLWLPEVGGIDPSLFFDDDGTVYLLNNDAPAGPPRYEGHRAIWIRPIDLATGRQRDAPRVLVDGGVEPGSHPIWIEGPHLYKVDGWYYLSAAEGGTGPQHSQVILRSRDVLGPYVAAAHNPILTQRDLPADRPHPVTNAGHADMVQMQDGTWWAVFLASRTYGAGHYNTGRETFLLPVTWRDGWPSILAPGVAIPAISRGPTALSAPAPAATLTGNFTWRDDFDTASLAHDWLQVRVPSRVWHDLRTRPGMLAIQPLAEGLDTLRNPAFLARRLQHTRFALSTAMELPRQGTAAGLAAFQSEQHWYFLGVRRQGASYEIFIERREGDRPAAVLASNRIDTPSTSIQLHISGDGARGQFGYDTGTGTRWLLRDADLTILSTERAGGFVGAMVGPHARDERTH